MPSAAFTSLVELCRISRAPRVAGTDLILELTASSHAVALLGAVEADRWNYTVKLGGVETTKTFDRLAEGAEAELIVHGMTRAQQVVANNVGTLLRFNQGAFLGSPPAEFYLINENHASWEAAKHDDVLAYERALKVVDWVRRLADVMKEKAGTAAGEAVILATRKLNLPLVYDVGALSHVAPLEDIEGIDADVFSEHHHDARIDIAKRVLVRFFDSVPEADRFAGVLRRLSEVRQAFLADFDVYASEFNFDKAREDFERKKLDFQVKINAASTDVMNKLIAIPVGQGLLASQMKPEIGMELVNASLLFASVIFAVVAVAVLVTQINTLLLIRAEWRIEKELLNERASPTFGRLKDMIGKLEHRLNFNIWCVPIALGLLLAASTAMTFVVANKLTGTVAPPVPATAKPAGAVTP
ncbi:hypothetical protein PRJ39_04635 [Lysobacter enzymogenes]|uniref:hypothetical protein n=1 Tax=Lysobacter enzymogenes TaxID=69 RepID=UPI00374A35BF